jgi:hypothetical protein
MYVRASTFVILLALLVSVPFASTLAVKVTVTQDTLAVGTNVSVVTGGVELAMQKAGLDGYARFNVSDGSYFIVLPRSSIYPTYVSLVRVNGNTNITLTKWMPSPGSPANAYGQIFGPTDFSNASVIAYSNGLVAKKVAPNRDGFYILSLQEGNYELVFSAPGFEAKKEQAFLPTAEFMEVNAALTKPLPKIEQPPVLLAPPKVQQYSVIEVSLTKEGAPLAGEELQVQTPSGAIALKTDSEGKVRINAAEAGTYKFAYGALSASTSVGAAQQPPPPPPPEAPPQAPTNLPPQQQGEAGAGYAGLLAIFVLLALVAIVVMIALVFRLAKKGRPHGGKHGEHKKHHHGK